MRATRQSDNPASRNECCLDISWQRGQANKMVNPTGVCHGGYENRRPLAARRWAKRAAFNNRNINLVLASDLFAVS